MFDFDSSELYQAPDSQDCSQLFQQRELKQTAVVYIETGFNPASRYDPPASSLCGFSIVQVSCPPPPPNPFCDLPFTPDL